MNPLDRRSFLKKAGLTALASGTLGSLALRSYGSSSTRPNILIVSVDQMRLWDPTSMPNNPSRPTVAALLPNITKLTTAGNAAITNPADPLYNPGSGVTFTNYFAAATACTPARAAWVTGLYAPQTRMYDTENGSGQPALDPAFPTWGSILTDADGTYGFQQLGYNTAWMGKWHLSDMYGSPKGLQPYGFSYAWPGVSPNGDPNEGASGGLSGYGVNSQELVSDAQIADNFPLWFNANATKQPWCATVSFVNPHDIAAAPIAFGPILDPANAILDAETAQQEYSVCFPLSSSFPKGGFLGSVFDGYFSKGMLADGIPNFEKIQVLSDLGVKPELQGATMQGRQLVQGLCNADGSRKPMTDETYVRNMDIYLWLWSMVDQQIGKVLDTLWANPEVAAKTVIVFCSDHGEFGGAHGMIDKTGALYDEGIHVPLTIWYPYALQNASTPQVYQGTRNFPCSAVDFCPLILTLASGSEQWRQNSALAHLKDRQSIFNMLAGHDNVNPRNFTLSTTDELLVDEGTPDIASGQHHLIAFRNAGGKFVQSSYWQPCTDTVDTTRPQFFEFYDYAGGNSAEIGNDITTSPNAKSYGDLFTAAVAKEFVLPPVGLDAPYMRALTNYLAYAAAATSGGCAT